MTEPETEALDVWAVIEMMGHRRVAGRVREVQLAGAGFLRLDIPATDGHAEQTQFISPGSVYALHPVDETVARHMAGQLRPEPVHRWELPSAEKPGDDLDVTHEHDDEDFDPDYEGGLYKEGDL